MDIDKAVGNQLKNIEARTGRTLGELATHVQASGLTKFGEVREMLKTSLGMSHGDANAVVKHLQAQAAPPSTDALSDIYTGPKAALRPIHDTLMAKIGPFGEFEVAPKKGYVSLRRKKQFAMVGPATNTRVEVGINLKGKPGTERLVEQPPGGMCQYKVKVTSADEVDSELIGWLREAYEAAG